MQAAFSVRKSPLGIVRVIGVLLVTLLLGGIGGFVAKGAMESPAQAARSASVPAARSLYVQGGRPPSVYLQAAETPSIYVQGGRPQNVYDEIARLEKK